MQDIYDETGVENVPVAASVDEIAVSTIEEAPITMFEAFPSTGNIDSLNHALLNNREADNQHPISSITGLRAELDSIEKLQTIYSDKYGSADYYIWKDGKARDEYGYFVSLADKNFAIKICEGTDILGVTISSAAFIGNQSDIARDNKYGLVATTGVVEVQCETDVQVGDCVVSNSRGIATKTDSECGYKVVAVETKFGIPYAVIALGVQACTTDVMGQNIRHLGERMDDAEINITTAMNIAHEAYNKATGNSYPSGGTDSQPSDIVDRVDNIESAVEDLDTQVDQATLIATQAKTAAETARDEAVTAANDATAKVANLTSTLTPILEWESEDEQYKGASFVDYFDDENIKTKEQIETLTTKTEEHSSAILQNGKGIKMIVSSVDKYSIGEYSQARGLTLEQARNILKKDIIYIPIKQGQDTYTHSEKYADGTESPQEFRFSCGFYYIWDGEHWNEDNTQCVALPYIENLGNNIPVGGSSLKFWFTDSNTAPEGYEPMALYMWDEAQDENGDTSWQWVKVNTLAGNVNNRITSMIRQDVDSVTAEIVNAYGSVAGFGAQLSDTTAKANMAATWILDNDPSASDSTIRNVAAVDISADKDGSQMALVVSQEDGNRTVKGASIVMDQNGTDSYIAISADNIVMDGTAKFITSEDLSGKGTTEINGANITTGTIDAEKIKVTDLNAFEATIAGWEISDDALFYEDAENNLEVGLSPGKGGAHKDLGLVLYAGAKQPSDRRDIAGTWRFKDSIITYMQQTYLNNSEYPMKFEFYGWVNMPSIGWTRCTGDTASLKFVSGIWADEDESAKSPVYSDDYKHIYEQIFISIAGTEMLLWERGHDRLDNTDYVIDNMDCLLNREIGFGPTGIWDTTINELSVAFNILPYIATFIPGSIGLYPAMLDKDGRLYAQEVRLGGSADSMIDVQRCAVGNIIINDDTIVYKKGWARAGGFYLGKDGLTVGENFKVQPKGVATGSVIVGNAADVHTDGTVACKILKATESVESETVTATTLGATVVNATTTNSETISVTNGGDIKVNKITLSSTEGNGYGYLNDWAWLENGMWGITKRNSYYGEDNVWSGIGFDPNNLSEDQKNVFAIGKMSLTGSWESANFRVSSRGMMHANYAELTFPSFFEGLADSYGNCFLRMPKNISEGQAFYVQLEGVWKDGGGVNINSSDARLKHDIESLDERYDVFFDNLEAQRFKYNVGTSDRYHLGYITQGVQKALATAEIPEKEFAGVVTLNQGTENEESALRYYEFVSLNTDQIQKLKKRVDALEAKNVELEVKNAELEARLAKLEALLINNAE